MKLALFRADGSRHLGAGHIMRCLAFAQGLEKIGLKPIFVIRDYEPKITELIQHFGYDVETIAQDSSFPEDASLTLEFASRYGVKLIITDLSNTDVLKRLGEYREYLQRLKDQEKFLITIDHRNEMTFPSDILINPTYGADKMNYDFNRSTKLLLGPAYFIFRQEFIEAAKVSRVMGKDAQNILVTIGGSDPLNLTVKVAKALCRLEKTSNLNLRIVLGIDHLNSAVQELKESLRSFRGNYELLQGSDNMADLLLWSDLAITGAGLTKYETAVTGTPSIVISQATHHARAMERFEKEKTSLHLGLSNRVSEDDIAEATAKLLKDHVLRAEMSKRGKKLVDVRGIERIISEIPQEVFS